MLSSRYLHLHEALGLGPMWLQQGAKVLPHAQTNTHLTPEAQPAITAPTQPSVQDVRQTMMAALGSETNKSANTETLRVRPPLADVIDTSDTTIQALSATTLPDALSQCQRCLLHQQRRQALPGHGHLHAKLLVISPNPAPEDDMAAQLFSGEVGILLHNMLMAIGIDPATVYFTSQVKCTPNVALQVSNTELTACAAFLQQQISWIQPQAVLLLGQSFHKMAPAALATMLQQRPYVVVPHPAQLLRQHQLKASAWQQLQQLAKILST